mgnify:CR=1 FL=1
MSQSLRAALFTPQSLLWLAVFTLLLLWSGIEPSSRFTWVLEVAPALIGLFVLIVTRRYFPLSPLLYGLILLHSLILMVGGHYTYAEVPLFDWIAEWTGGTRNNFDKVGHFAQGFVPTLIVREIVIRREIILKPFWVGFFSLCFSLAFSAFYELIEWWVALWVGESSEAFLGTQGYVWDTQSDMFYALVGGLIALLLMSHWHNRQIRTLETA